MADRKRHPKDKLFLQNAMKTTLKIIPDGSAAMIITKRCGDGDHPVQYVGNLEREDAIKLLKELLFRWGEKEEWMTHIE